MHYMHLAAKHNQYCTRLLESGMSYTGSLLPHMYICITYEGVTPNLRNFTHQMLRANSKEGCTLVILDDVI